MLREIDSGSARVWRAEWERMRLSSAVQIHDETAAFVERLLASLPGAAPELRKLVLEFWRLHGPALDYCTCKGWSHLCLYCKLRAALEAGPSQNMMPRIMALVGGVLMLCDELERSNPGFPMIDGKRLRTMALEVRDGWGEAGPK